MPAIAKSESKALSKSVSESQVNAIFENSDYEAEFIGSVLNYILEKQASIKAVCEKFNLTYRTVISWIEQFNAAVGPRNSIKRNLRPTYSDELKGEAVELYNKGIPATTIADKLKVTNQSIYTWIRQAAQKTAVNKSNNKSKTHPTVSKAMEDIRTAHNSGETHSLASDFGISENAENRETSTPVEIKFCPCCGTNIKAVMIALQTCQELR